MANNQNLKPFKKKDARINRGGRPRNVDLIHEIAVRLCMEPADLADNPEGICRLEAIMREWLTSKNFHKQLAVIQYAYGKVPDQIEVQKKEPRTVIIEWGDDPYDEPDEEQEEVRRKLRSSRNVEDQEEEEDGLY